MDTKTDTKSRLRICSADPAFGVHLGVHSSVETVQPHYTIRACSARFFEGLTVGERLDELLRGPIIRRLALGSPLWCNAVNAREGRLENGSRTGRSQNS
jgi:hypothetical protein